MNDYMVSVERVTKSEYLPRASSVETLTLVSMLGEHFRSAHFRQLALVHLGGSFKSSCWINGDTGNGKNKTHEVEADY